MQEEEEVINCSKTCGKDGLPDGRYLDQVPYIADTQIDIVNIIYNEDWMATM